MLILRRRETTLDEGRERRLIRHRPSSSVERDSAQYRPTHGEQLAVSSSCSVHNRKSVLLQIRAGAARMRWELSHVSHHITEVLLLLLTFRFTCTRCCWCRLCRRL